MIRIFKVVVPASILALLLSEAVLITTCYIASLFVLISADPELFLLYEGGALRIGLVTAVIILGLYFSDLYSNIRVRSTFLLIQQVCLSLGIAFISQALLSYVNPELILPRWVMIYGSTLVLVLLPTWRVLYARYLVPAFGSRRFLFLGDSPALDELAEGALERPELGLSVLGYVFRTERPASDSSLKYLGPMSKLREVVRELKPDAIVVGMAERRQQLPMHDLLELRFSGVPVLEATKLYESVFGRVNTRDLRPSQLIFTEELGPNPGNVAIQTVYNFVIAAFGLVILSPVLILTAIAVRLSSPGPILLRQVRSGYQEQPYTLYKFRSMYQDAEARTGAVWASKNDPRITPIGIHLRRFRLDEIPQLFNVLKGEMAIAGPRPERPEFVQTLSEQIEFFRQRNCVKPGITGWAQINSGYSENVEDVVRKLEYDLYYIKHLSFSLDFYIYFHTLKTMVLRRGSQ